ncbi:MAG TPA: hypothetical protein VF491_12155, partial [Vicinamibacterales bacterium]
MAIAAGMRHACGIESTGETYYWGFNFIGETGSTAYGETIAAPNKVPGGKVFVSLGAGSSFTCGLSEDGRAYCWGAGNRGELGRAVPACNSVYGIPNYCSATPVAVNTSATFTIGILHGAAICGRRHCAPVQRSARTCHAPNRESAGCCGAPRARAAALSGPRFALIAAVPGPGKRVARGARGIMCFIEFPSLSGCG